VARQWKKTVGGLDVLEQDARGWTGALDIAQLRTVCTLSFIESRVPVLGKELAPLGLDPGYNWRRGRPVLAAWYDRSRTNTIFTKMEADRWFGCATRPSRAMSTRSRR